MLHWLSNIVGQLTMRDDTWYTIHFVMHQVNPNNPPAAILALSPGLILLSGNQSNFKPESNIEPESSSLLLNALAFYSSLVYHSCKCSQARFCSRSLLMWLNIAGSLIITLCVIKVLSFKFQLNLSWSFVSQNVWLVTWTFQRRRQLRVSHNCRIVKKSCKLSFNIVHQS